MFKGKKNSEVSSSMAELEESQQLMNYYPIEAIQDNNQKKEVIKQQELPNIYSLINFYKKNSQQLMTMQKRGFHTNKMNQGPICGTIAYWVVKGGAYVGICVATGAAIAAATPVIVAGTTAGGITAAGASLVAAGADAAIIAASGSGVIGVVGAATATGVVTAGAAGGATTVAGAALATGSGAAGVVAGIETAAAAAGAVFGLCPFLP